MDGAVYSASPKACSLQGIAYLLSVQQYKTDSQDYLLQNVTCNWFPRLEGGTALVSLPASLDAQLLLNESNIPSFLSQ